MAVLNEFERDQIAERTSSILQLKKSRREVYSPIPYGFRREGKHLLVDENEQKVIRNIKDLRADGISLRQIARELNDEGVPSKNDRKWYASTVHYILNNSLHTDKVQVP